MSDTNSPKKIESVSKKNESKKAEPVKSEPIKTEKANAETKSADSSTPKSVSPPKSASQSSISHFSSVSTPQYRSGWNSIFSDESGAKRINPDKVRGNDFPKKLNILDYDIDVKLRSALDAAFNDLAKKRDIHLEDQKNPLRFEYSVNCVIKEK
ncbi:MAG: hypothetical protein RI860_04420, partial [Planktomarina sp.]|nr:hypothetical protein [Planktomarina sp.]